MVYFIVCIRMKGIFGTILQNQGKCYSIVQNDGIVDTINQNKARLYGIGQNESRFCSIDFNVYWFIL